MSDLVLVPVEKLSGDERTEYGVVDHTIHEADGVDCHLHEWERSPLELR